MKGILTVGGMAAALLCVIGCRTVPPGAERGPQGTMGYDVLIEASAPGAKIEANGEIIGDAPLHLKIFGDTDGTFHDFGSDYYLIRALPVTTNQFAQVRMFGTGHWFGPEDRIPERIYFDMNQRPPEYPPGGPAYPYPYPYYYAPPPYYYGPSIYFYNRPYYHYYHHHDGIRVRPR